MGSVSKVYFTRVITPEQVVKMYDILGKKLEGKIAIKVHSGEEGNQNYLKPEFWKPIVEHVGGTVVECNTAYEGERNSTDKHVKLIKKHGWNDFFVVDLIYKSDDSGKEHFLERVQTRNGEHTIDVAAEMGFGVKEYELITV